MEAVDEGAVEVALIREESSAVDAVLVFEAPLPLPAVSIYWIGPQDTKYPRDRAPIQYF